MAPVKWAGRPMGSPGNLSSGEPIGSGWTRRPDAGVDGWGRPPSRSGRERWIRGSVPLGLRENRQMRRRRCAVPPMVRMSLVSCLQVSGDNGEVWGGYGGRVRSVALATTRGCSAFHPLAQAHIRTQPMPGSLGDYINSPRIRSDHQAPSPSPSAVSASAFL